MILHYFPVRGRGEVFKLECAVAGLEYELRDVDYQAMKTDRKAYPFGQCPRLVDGDVDICQSNAIIRHVARKAGLYGKDNTEAALVDMVIDAVESLRTQYYGLVYVNELAPEAKATYWATHGALDSTEARNKGSHLAYMEGLLARNGGGGAYVIGTALSAADLCLWDIIDLHLRIFGDELRASYPLLVSHHTRVAALPGIKEYLASPARVEKVNGNGLG